MHGYPASTEPDTLPSWRVLILGEFPADLLADGLVPERTVPVATDDAGRVSVREALRAHRPAPGGTAPDSPPLLLLTSHDLSLAGCDTLFGYASVRDRMAIVSSHRLESEDRALVRRRLAAVMAHERGHLDGLRHCPTRGCLMTPARGVADLDERGLARCGLCQRPQRRLLGTLAAAAGFVLLIASLDACAEILKVRKQPFNWQASNGRVAVFFKDTPLVTLADNGAVPTAERAELMTRSLNRLFLQVHPPSLEVQPKGAEGAVIRAGTLPVGEVLPSDAGGHPALEVAQQWAGQIQPLLRAKGLAGESCPGCHVTRIDEIDREMRTKGTFRR